MRFYLAVDEFLANLRRKGYSKKTIDAYSFDLGRFGEFIEDEKGEGADKIEIGSIGKDIIRRWIDRCLENGNTPRTISRKTATCRSFFKFLIEEDIIKVNPSENIPIPRTPKKVPASLSQDEIRQLICAPSPEEPDYKRNTAIIMLLYSTGIRVGELVSLKMEQVMLETQSIRIKGKGAKERVIPMTDSSRRAVLEYFVQREKDDPRNAHPKAPAFITRKGKPMTARMIQYMVQKYGREAGIITHVHPHLIRHSIASHLIDEGANVEAVRQTLGHEDLATTSIYLKTSSRFLQKEHRDHNPADRLAGKEPED